MKRLKAIIYGTLFVILFSLFFIRLQGIVTQKYFNDGSDNANGLYEEKDDDIEVLFLGASQAVCGFDPLVMYEDYGVAGYVYAASWQHLQITDYWLKEALKTQSPKVVVLECGNCFQTEDEIPDNEIQLSMPYIKNTPDKIQFLFDAAGREWNDKFYSYVFPLLQFKARWKEWDMTDFKYRTADKFNYSRGRYYCDTVLDEACDLSSYNDQTIMEISDLNRNVMDSIVAICAENDIQLILVKLPQTEWTKGESKAIQDYADTNDLLFIDYFTVLDEIEFDTKNDFWDVRHMNDFGAEKVSKHLGKLLVQCDGITDRRMDTESNAWDISLEKKLSGENMNREVW